MWFSSGASSNRCCQQSTASRLPWPARTWIYIDRPSVLPKKKKMILLRDRLSAVRGWGHVYSMRSTHVCSMHVQVGTVRRRRSHDDKGRPGRRIVGIASREAVPSLARRPKPALSRAHHRLARGGSTAPVRPAPSGGIDPAYLTSAPRGPDHGAKNLVRIIALNAFFSRYWFNLGSIDGQSSNPEPGS